MTLQEVDRLLQFVTATVQSVAETPEQPQQIDAVGELQDVIHIIQASHPHITEITLAGDSTLACALPRDAFRVTVYSLLEHMIGSFKPHSPIVEVEHGGGRALIQFLPPVERDDAHSGAHQQWAMDRHGGSDAIGLLIAERFARDIGGRLACSVSANASQVFTLDLPCIHV